MAGTCPSLVECHGPSARFVEVLQYRIVRIFLCLDGGAAGIEASLHRFGKICGRQLARTLCIVPFVCRARKMPSRRTLCMLPLFCRARKFASHHTLCIVPLFCRARKFASRRTLCILPFVCRAHKTCADCKHDSYA